MILLFGICFPGISHVAAQTAAPLKIEQAAEHLLEIEVPANSDHEIEFPTPAPNVVQAIDDRGQPASLLFNHDASEIKIVLGNKHPRPKSVHLVTAEQSIQLTDGTLIFSALDANIIGDTAKLESHPGNHRIGFWTDANDSVEWSFTPSRWGRYQVDLIYSLAGARGTEIQVAIEPSGADSNLNSPKLTTELESTGSWYHYKTANLGVHYFDDATYNGPHQIKVECTKKIGAAVMNLKAVLLTPTSEGVQPVVENEDGVLVFKSKDATVLGTRLVYEPNPKKLTLGWWARETDKARWEFNVKTPGQYEVQVLQGCGKGQGGSRVAIEALSEFAWTTPGKTKPLAHIEFDVLDTGHFQNFQWRTVGRMNLENGNHQLQVRPIKKAKNAVMDLRELRLVPVDKNPTAIGNPPNIVLIMADDLGWKDLHCYGNERLDTPIIDQLARDGFLFTDAYSASPVCTPTRAAMMTGESPARLNITNHAPGHPSRFRKPGTHVATPEWLRHLPLERVTLAEQLKEAGYATGFVGKWHLSHRKKNSISPTEQELRPEHQGFDTNIGGCSFGGPPSYFEPYKIPNITPIADGRYLPDRCAQECIDFVSENKERPFFLCWWNYSVHYPFQAPEDLIAKYRERKGIGIENPTYAAMIDGMDRSIGRLLDRLDELDLAENTLVVFTSDNGPFAANVKPLRGEKGYLYEGGIRVPLIARWPGKIAPGTRSATPVITMDIHATILEVAGLQPDPGNTPDGLSLSPLLFGQGPLNREAIFFHYPNYAFHKQNRFGSVIRAGDFKLIKRYDDDSVELYDLQSDIGETINLANELPEQAAILRTRLESWLSETGASQPSPTAD